MTSQSLDHLRTFVTVWRTGSLTRAADLLGISQPTVSAHIHALERSLGYAVFTRGPAGVSATPKGTELAREVAAHLDAIEDATAGAGAPGPLRRSVHIGGAADILSLMVLPRIAEARDEVDATLRFVFGLADDLLDQLAARSLDIVVSAVPPRRRGITSVPVYDEEFVLVAAPRWTGAALDEVPVVAYAENLPIIRRYWRSEFGKRPEPATIAAIIPDLRGIRSAVLAGAGLSVLPRYLVEGDLAEGSLVALHSPEVPPLNTLYLATRGREWERDAQLGAAAEFLRRCLR